MKAHMIFVILTIFVVNITLLLYYNFEKFSQNSNKSKQTVYFFYTDWCKFSQKMMPIWELTTSEYNSDKIKFVKINCDKSNYCLKYKIKFLPTIIIDENGKITKYTDDISQIQLNNFFVKNLNI